MSNHLSFPWRARSWHGPTIEDCDGGTIGTIAEPMRRDFIVNAVNVHGELVGTIRELLTCVNRSNLVDPYNFAATSRALRVMSHVLSAGVLANALAAEHMSMSTPADALAMNSIHALLNSGKHFTSEDAVGAIAEIVRGTGRKIGGR